MLFLPEDVFDLCLDRAKKLMGSEIYNSWLSTASFRSFNNGVFTIGLDSEIRANFVTHNYKVKLEELLREVSGDTDVSVIFTHVPETLSVGRMNNSSRHELFSNFLKPGYVFDRFIQGPNNRLAFATAQSVAYEMGQSSTNPLFIYGGVGLGKTHLVQAVANHIKTNHPDKTFCYISSEEFLTMFLRAMIPNKNNFMALESFKDRFRNSHYLIMDDVQFLSNKETTQDLFFHLFNDLYLRGRQIIVTSDRPPHELEPLAERLISRFQSGMVVDIKPPVLETRLAILNQKLRDENIVLDKDIIFYLAETVKSNVRQLEGAVNLIAANIRIQNIDLTLENVRSITTEYLGASSRRLNPASITSSVAEFFSVNPNTLKGKQRKREILVPRQISMYLMRDLTNLSLEEIGSFFGRDHSTVLNAIKRINSMMADDTFFKRKIIDLRESLLV
ncbi:MAG: chromosomal replication initiator protein DnaA [Candidatus Sabulitectum sp.]|nr:chromosomal replication initiator protein DnaA [Candidatus Sabulitectum sp.]